MQDREKSNGRVFIQVCGVGMTNTTNSSLIARIRLTAEGIVFKTEEEYETLEALVAATQRLKARFNDAVQVEAVLFYFHSDRCLDENSVAALTPVLQSLGVAPEHYFNEAAGLYDRYMNTVTPYDMGVVFPDGTVRLVWSEDTAKSSIEHSFNVLNQNIAWLLEIQEEHESSPLDVDEGDDPNCVIQDERRAFIAMRANELKGV